MNNKNISVCELSNYCQPFKGNFIASLFDLEKKIILYNPDNKFIYVFYDNSKDCSWINEMRQSNKNIFFLKNKYFFGFLVLKNIIKKYDINIIHSHYTIPVLLFFLLKIFFPKLVIIAHFHNLFSGIYNISLFKKKLKTKIKLSLYNKKLINLFCGCGEAVYNNLINCGIQKEKCLFIDNCIDFSRFDNIKTENNFKEIIKNKKVLLISGYFYFTKGVDIAINAIKDIIDKYNIILMIFCNSKESLMKDIKNTLGYIPDWILIVPTQENISEYFKISNIYLIPSREEGFPYTMLESIYCETLTIRSDIPSTDRNLPNDFVVPLNDSNSLRYCIESVLSLTENEKISIISKQKNYIIQKWNINIWSNNIINMYLNSLNKV